MNNNAAQNMNSSVALLMNSNAAQSMNRSAKLNT